MTFVDEGALAHARACIAECQVVVGLSPSELLGGGEYGLLRLLGVVALLAVLAPAGLVLALGAVLRSVLLIILHFENIVKASSSVFLFSFSLSSSWDDLVLSEIIDVGVLLLELVLEGLDLPLRCVFGLASLFLKSIEATEIKRLEDCSFW